MKTVNEPHQYLGKEEVKYHRIDGYNKEGRFKICLFIYVYVFFGICERSE